MCSTSNAFLLYVVKLKSMASFNDICTVIFIQCENSILPGNLNCEGFLFKPVKVFKSSYKECRIVPYDAQHVQIRIHEYRNNNHAFKASRQKMYIKNVVKNARLGCLRIILLWCPYFGYTIVFQKRDCYSAVNLL